MSMILIALMFFIPYQVGANIGAFQIANSIANSSVGPALNSLFVPFAESFFVVLPLVAIYLAYKKDPNVYTFTVAIVVLYVVSEVLKNIFQEPRPCSVSELSWINHPICETNFSFPSNHASVLTGPLIFMLKYRIITILYVIWLILILFGRVYLGQHYLTDVIAGAAISIIIAFALYKIRNHIHKIASILHLTFITGEKVVK